MFTDNRTLKVVNLFGGPGTGKSTTAASLFSMLKKQGKSVELVSEFAKDCVWEQRNNIFTEQDLIFAEQHRRIRRLVSRNIEYAITDSPLLLTLLYTPDWYPKTFEPFVMDVFHSYTNHNFFLRRNLSLQYDDTGRNQNYEQAKQKDAEMEQLLFDRGISYCTINVNDYTEENIFNILL